MPSTFTQNLHLEQQATGENAGVWGQVLNNSVFSVIDAAMGNVLSLPLTNLDVTLTTTQTQNNFIDLSGTLTANVNVIFPAIGRTFYVRNGTTGDFSVTLKTTAVGGASFIIPQGATAFVVLNGTDVLPNETGDWVPIATRTFVNSSGFAFTNLGAFRRIRLGGYVTQSAVTGVNIQFSTDNGVSYDTGATSYSFQSNEVAGTTFTGNSGLSIAFLIIGPGGYDAGSQTPFEVELENFNQNANCRGFSKHSGTIGGQTKLVSLGCSHTGTTARNAFRISMTSGTISGYVQVEGVRG